MPNSSLYCTGPAHAYIRKHAVDSQRYDVAYLGTCQYSPSIKLISPVEIVTSNRRGPKVADDWLLAGQEAIISLNLTKWVEATYALIANKGTKRRGTMAFADIGAMLRRENLAFETTIVFPYAGYAPLDFPDMPDGYRFPVCSLDDEIFDPIGTQARVLGLIIHAIPEDSGTNLLLYDDDVAGLPNPK